MESIHQTTSPEQALHNPQDVFDRIEEVKGGLREKLHEANAILLEIRQKPKEDMSRERYILESATLKLIEYFELEIKQEEIGLELAKRNTELLRMGIEVSGVKATKAANGDILDTRYSVGDNRSVA
ncbi:MAG: hypothetical protein RI935_457 [Candidatus Parcubacteria bacterium]|jgi:hypothetical protein